MGKRKTVEGIPSNEAVVGDICMYGIYEGKLIIVNDWDSSKYPIDKYPPIGVVVVPGSHGHYEGGKCAIMSLNYMSCDTPTTGGKPQLMRIGDELVLSEINGNKQYNVYTNGNNNEVTNKVTGYSDSNVYLPSDKSTFTAVTNPYDKGTNYSRNYSYTKYAPSPYNNDGTFNTEYARTTSPSTDENGFSDFNGYSNTKKILDVRGTKDYSTWKPTFDNKSDYPAVSCCDMYFTPGTKQGDWYLPADGELGYVTVRQKIIENALNKLSENGVVNAIGFDDVSMLMVNNVVSSSTYAMPKNHDLSSGLVGLFGMIVYTYYCRAFMLV